MRLAHVETAPGHRKSGRRRAAAAGLQLHDNSCSECGGTRRLHVVRATDGACGDRGGAGRGARAHRSVLWTIRAVTSTVTLGYFLPGDRQLWRHWCVLAPGRNWPARGRPHRLWVDDPPPWLDGALEGQCARRAGANAGRRQAMHRRVNSPVPGDGLKVSDAKLILSIRSLSYACGHSGYGRPARMDQSGVPVCRGLCTAVHGLPSPLGAARGRFGQAFLLPGFHQRTPVVSCENPTWRTARRGLTAAHGWRGPGHSLARRTPGVTVLLRAARIACVVEAVGNRVPNPPCCSWLRAGVPRPCVHTWPCIPGTPPRQAWSGAEIWGWPSCHTWPSPTSTICCGQAT
jgi:hypothetical protein